ncbi:hypothetical protein ACFW9D_04055 [Streptomyces sp. NPDC059524]|uniref:hypothetical protein n=1 Tax=Streptomyces sp. NPDC059524 TaxID=3346856 RepID=UPI0036C5B772
MAETGAGAGQAGEWGAEVVERRRSVGSWRFPAREVAARRDGLRIETAVGSVTCVDDSGRIRWTHRCVGRPNAVHLSGDRVLVTTDSLEYTPWGMLGPALLLDLADGRLVAELRGARGAARGGGRFLLGLEGYDFFDTWEYDRDGDRTDAWRSYGHYVVGTGVRVVEADRNLPTKGRVVRLLPGGVIRQGPSLSDPQPPEPLVLRDGTILVLDGARLRSVDRDLRSRTLVEIEGELGPVAASSGARVLRSLRRSGEQVTVMVGEPLPDDPARFTIHTWTIVLRPVGR